MIIPISNLTIKNVGINETRIALLNAFQEMGAEIVKLFPGNIYGPEFVKAIKGPQPWTSIMPTGGVSTDPENLKQWFEAGVTCIGMGSKLISKTILETQNFDTLEKNTAKTIATIKKLKAK